MKKSKKLLSILLTLCMLLSAVPIVALPASAAGSITMSCGTTYDSSGNKITEGTNANVYCEEIPSWVLPVTFNSSGMISSTPVTGDFEVGSTYNFYLKFTDSYNCEFTSTTRTIQVRETDAVIIKFISNKTSSSAGTWKYSLNGAPSVSTGGVTFTAGTSADISLIASGTEITATAIPVDGYSVVLSSTDVTFKTNENGVATFDMPAKAVTVTATYTEIPKEFYAVLNKTEETGKVANTLSFYYDTNMENYSDTTKYTVYSGDDLPTNAAAKDDWGYYEIRESIKNVVIDKSVAEYDKLTSTAYMFYNFKYADDISGCEYLNVSNVTSMKNMFAGYAYYSTNINAVPDVSDWNTSKVTTMYSMFFCYAYNSTSITAVPDVSNWNTEKVTSMGSMFSAYGYVSANTLESLDLSDWSVNELTDASGMFFYYNYSATGDKPVVYGTDWSKKAGVEASSMFKDSKIKNATTDSDSATNWAKATTEEGGCFTVAPDRVFYAVLDSSNTLSFYYDRKKDTRTGTFYEGDALPTNAANETDWGYNNVRANIKSVVIDKSVEKFTGLTSTARMFYNFRNADSISGCEYLDVSNVTDMKYMFYNYAYNSTSIAVVPDVSNWNTENVTDMTYMFTEYAHTSAGLDAVPDVSNWNTGKVTTVEGMFSHYAYSSTSITAVPDVSKWNTENVTDMSYMFYEYAYTNAGLDAVPDVSKWNTGKVTTVEGMFYNYAYSSTSITAVPDVSNWNTENMIIMTFMFIGYAYSSTSITAVPDVSNWNTEKVMIMMSMFARYGYSSTNTLEPLDLSGWNIESLTFSYSMFSKYGYSNSGTPIVYGTEWSTKTGVNGNLMFKDSKLKNAATTYAWSQANTKDTCCFTSKYVIDEAVANATYSAFLTLKDNIDISFKMKDLGTDKNGASFDKTKLSFTVNGKDLTQSATFTYADGVASGMTVSVSPEEMSKNVHIVVKYNGGKIKDFYYSVLSYCNSVATAYASDNDTYAKLNDLCTAVLNYGKYAEDNKNGNTDSTLNSSCEITEWSEIETVSGSSSAEANAAASLTLGSTISLNFYVTNTVTANQVKIYNDNDEQVEAKYITVTESDKEGYNTKITVSGIYAEHLSNAYTLKVDNEKMITYGVYNYCADVVVHETDETYTETLQTLCKAIYNYGEKAAAYAA